MSRITLILGCWLLLQGAAARADEKPSEADLDFFEKKIRPVLVTHCYECHSEEAETLHGGLLLDTREGIRGGGDSGAAVVPGKIDESLLIEALRYDDSLYQMPPDGRLSDQVIRDFEQWITRGAADPREGTPIPGDGIDAQQANRHWAFQPVQRVKRPAVQDTSWPKAEVDYFILSRLEEAGLVPAPSVDKRSLIRRVTFDLIGLPPTPKEIANFLADDSPEAFEKVVDRLLASPHYGERWARHWMDLVRYAETNGHNRDIDKPSAFRYRDYLIDAFNEDVPFDRFILENLAGDQLPPRPTDDGRFNASLMGTGMLWFSELHHNPVDPHLQRADQVDSQVDTVGKAFLGLTLGCARCHDHKFDPVSIEDYYAMAGIFHSTQSVLADIGMSASRSRGDVSPREVKQLEEELKYWLFDAVDEPRLREVRRASDYLRATSELIHLQDEAFEQALEEWVENEKLNRDILRQWMVFLRKGDTPVNANLGPWLKIINEPEDRLHETIQQVVADNPPAGGKPVNPFTMAALTEPLPTSFAELADRYQEIMEMIVTTKRYNSPSHKQWLNWFHRPDTPFTYAGFAEDLEEDQLEILESKRRRIADSKQQSERPKALAGVDAGDSRWAEWTPIRSPFQERREASRATLGDVRLHIRGSHANLGKPVPRGFLSILGDLGSLTIEEGRSGRLELAHAIADPDNPLTARVFVNRLWGYHFGVGLVPTVDNFGLRGEVPTHPELLDWLAAQFVQNDWSIKKMHRLMVLSHTYQMSHQPTEKGMQVDPDNRLWHHLPVRRLDAESIRDAILAVAGTLDRSLFGKGINPQLTPYMYPRYRPPSGPVDGNNRRSIYGAVRRNFIPPLMAAFDVPPPNDTVGSRDVTAVPNQALVLLNNEFVHQQAQRWGQRLAQEDRSIDERIDDMFIRAIARSPTATEQEAIRVFIETQREQDLAEQEIWSAVAHVVFNLKSFIFVR
ncbi:MAG: PSD1 and planctomycete cytochrome C domain-containing protein [Pirellulaceae bacterium]